MTSQMGIHVKDIKKVYLAGAFGNFLRPDSACRIDMIPPILLDRIFTVGNAAGEGAKRCALSRTEYERSKKLAKETRFMELAQLPEFQTQYLHFVDFNLEQ